MTHLERLLALYCTLSFVLGAGVDRFIAWRSWRQRRSEIRMDAEDRVADWYAHRVEIQGMVLRLGPNGRVRWCDGGSQMDRDGAEQSIAWNQAKEWMADHHERSASGQFDHDGEHQEVIPDERPADSLDAERLADLGVRTDQPDGLDLPDDREAGDDDMPILLADEDSEGSGWSPAPTDRIAIDARYYEEGHDGAEDQARRQEGPEVRPEQGQVRAVRGRAPQDQEQPGPHSPAERADAALARPGDFLSEQSDTDIWPLIRFGLSAAQHLIDEPWQPLTPWKDWRAA